MAYGSPDLCPVGSVTDEGKVTLPFAQGSRYLWAKGQVTLAAVRRDASKLQSRLLAMPTRGRAFRGVGAGQS